MRRWDSVNNRYLEDSDLEAKITRFLNDIEGICNIYGMSISHEDHQGSFVITNFDPDTILWLRSANSAIKL